MESKLVYLDFLTRIEHLFPMRMKLHRDDLHLPDKIKALAKQCGISDIGPGTLLSRMDIVYYRLREYILKGAKCDAKHITDEAIERTNFLIDMERAIKEANMEKVYGIVWAVCDQADKLLVAAQTPHPLATAVDSLKPALKKDAQPAAVASAASSLMRIAEDIHTEQDAMMMRSILPGLVYHLRVTDNFTFVTAACAVVTKVAELCEQLRDVLYHMAVLTELKRALFEFECPIAATAVRAVVCGVPERVKAVHEFLADACECVLADPLDFDSKPMYILYVTAILDMIYDCCSLPGPAPESVTAASIVLDVPEFAEFLVNAARVSADEPFTNFIGYEGVMELASLSSRSIKLLGAVSVAERAVVERVLQPLDPLSALAQCIACKERSDDHEHVVVTAASLIGAGLHTEHDSLVCFIDCIRTFLTYETVPRVLSALRLAVVISVQIPRMHGDVLSAVKGAVAAIKALPAEHRQVAFELLDRI